MSSFHKKMSQNLWATIMPFGPVTLIFYWPKHFFLFGPAGFISGTANPRIVLCSVVYRQCIAQTLV